MITVEVVLGIHRVLIKKYGGHPGVRDQTLLKSAIARSYHTFDGKDIKADENNKYDFVISIAAGNLSYDEILKWIKKRVENKKKNKES